jgi:membrane fusion protein, multidrug efflux system
VRPESLIPGLGKRARMLLGGPAGQQSTYDAAIAQRSLEVQAAQAQVEASRINLD